MARTAELRDIKKSYFVAAGLAGGVAAAKVINDMSELEVTEYNVIAHGIPKSFDGFRIIHLSDQHNKVYGKYNMNLFRLIANQKPDLAVLTGDMISHQTPDISSFLSLVRLLCTLVPVYYVNGNHEISDMDEVTFLNVNEEMQKAGAICLDNTYADFNLGNDVIRLCGICYTPEYYRGVREFRKNWKCFTLEAMIKLLEAKKSDLYTVLLAHNPLDFNIYSEWGADLTFSGHVHGGMVRLPLIKGIVSPERTLFPKYKEGIYYSGNSSLVVSRGLGRIRFFNRPELVSVVLNRV